MCEGVQRNSQLFGSSDGDRTEESTEALTAAVRGDGGTGGGEQGGGAGSLQARRKRPPSRVPRIYSPTVDVGEMSERLSREAAPPFPWPEGVPRLSSTSGRAAVPWPPSASTVAATSLQRSEIPPSALGSSVGTVVATLSRSSLVDAPMPANAMRDVGSESIVNTASVSSRNVDASAGPMPDTSEAHHSVSGINAMELANTQTGHAAASNGPPHISPQASGSFAGAFQPDASPAIEEERNLATVGSSNSAASEAVPEATSILPYLPPPPPVFARRGQLPKCPAGFCTCCTKLLRSLTLTAPSASLVPHTGAMATSKTPQAVTHPLRPRSARAVASSRAKCQDMSFNEAAVEQDQDTASRVEASSELIECRGAERAVACTMDLLPIQLICQPARSLNYASTAEDVQHNAGSPASVDSDESVVHSDPVLGGDVVVNNEAGVSMLWSTETLRKSTSSNHESPEEALSARKAETDFCAAVDAHKAIATMVNHKASTETERQVESLRVKMDKDFESLRQVLVSQTEEAVQYLVSLKAAEIPAANHDEDVVIGTFLQGLSQSSGFDMLLAAAVQVAEEPQPSRPTTGFPRRFAPPGCPGRCVRASGGPSMLPKLEHLSPHRSSIDEPRMRVGAQSATNVESITSVADPPVAAPIVEILVPPDDVVCSTMPPLFSVTCGRVTIAEDTCRSAPASALAPAPPDVEEHPRWPAVSIEVPSPEEDGVMDGEVELIWGEDGTDGHQAVSRLELQLWQLNPEDVLQVVGNVEAWHMAGRTTSACCGALWSTRFRAIDDGGASMSNVVRLPIGAPQFIRRVPAHISVAHRPARVRIRSLPLGVVFAARLRPFSRATGCWLEPSQLILLTRPSPHSRSDCCKSVSEALEEVSLLGGKASGDRSALSFEVFAMVPPAVGG